MVRRCIRKCQAAFAVQGVPQDLHQARDPAVVRPNHVVSLRKYLHVTDQLDCLSAAVRNALLVEGVLRVSALWTMLVRQVNAAAQPFLGQA